MVVSTNGTLTFDENSTIICPGILTLVDNLYKGASELLIFKLLSVEPAVDNFINESMNSTFIYIDEGMYVYITVQFICK